MKMWGYYLNDQNEWVRIRKPFDSKEDGLEYAYRKGYLYFKMISWDEENRKTVEVQSDD